MGCQSYFDSGDSSSYLEPNGDAASPDNYIQSLLAYTVFALCCGLICTLAILLLFTLRYCLYRDSGGLGGNRYPTARPDRQSSWSGALRSPPVGYVDESSEFRYPAWERWAARAFMTLAVVLLLVWVAVGWWGGGVDLHSEVNNVVESPLPLVSAVQSTQPAVSAFLVGLGDSVLAGMIANVSASAQRGHGPARTRRRPHQRHRQRAVVAERQQRPVRVRGAAGQHLRHHLLPLLLPAPLQRRLRQCLHCSSAHRRACLCVGSQSMRPSLLRSPTR